MVNVLNEKRESGRKDEAGGLSVATVRFLRAVIHGALEQAKVEGLVPRNVSEATRLPKGKKKKVSAMSQKDVKKMLISLQGDRLYALYVLEIGTGMRRGEILALTWDDINLDKGFVKINRIIMRTRHGELYFDDPKTEASTRTLPISASVVQALKTHHAQQAAEKIKLGKDKYVDNNLVFCQRNGEPMDPNNFTMRHYRLMQKLKLPTSFHILRHSVASALIGKVDPKVVQGTLGHESIQTTMNIYADLFDEVKRDASNKLDALIPESKQVKTKAKKAKAKGA